MRHSWIFAAGLVGLGGWTLAGWTCCRCALAQFEAPANTLAFEDEGTLEAVQDELIQFRDSKTEAWLLQLVPETKIKVLGEAEHDYLRPGLSIQFDATLDKKGALKKPIDEIEIFTPQGKTSIGLFPAGDDDPDAKPVRAPGPGEYRVKGKLAAFREGELVVSVGARKLVATVSDDFKVKVNLTDLSVAQNGDAVKVKAWYYENSKPIPALNRLGKARAEEITITLAKPLAGTIKRNRAADKPSRPMLKGLRTTKN